MLSCGKRRGVTDASIQRKGVFPPKKPKAEAIKLRIEGHLAMRVADEYSGQNLYR
jgi:hypothetical protein